MDKKNKTSILISIVTYKAEDFLKRTLTALAWTARYKNISIFIVDNSPTNKIENVVDHSRLDAAYHFTGENLGFGKGHNYALQKFISQHGYTPDMVLLVNPDLILKEKTFRILLTEMQEDLSLAVAGPKLLTVNGKLEKSVFTDPTAWEYMMGFIKKAFFPKREIQTGITSSKQTAYVKGLSGACMMIRTEALKSQMIFDPDYFMYFEDLDLCTRLREDGWKIKYIVEAKAVHSRGECSKDKKDRELWLKRMMYDSLSLYFKKNKGAMNKFLLWVTFSSVLKIKSMIGHEKKWSKETAISIDKIFQGQK